LIQDLRFGLRELMRDRGFALTSVLSIALGILAATAMFSVIHGVIIEPFPYKDIDNLVSIAVRNPEQRGWRTSYSPGEYAELARRATIFEGIAASTISDVLWMQNGEPVRLRGNHISHNGFDVMGVPAIIGRVVTGGEEDPETKAVLGYKFWVSRFGGDLGVLGKTLTLNGRARTIVGVMGPRFSFRGADVYLPMVYRAAVKPDDNEGVRSMVLTARRRAGVGNAQAQADLDPIIRDLAQKAPGTFPLQWKIELHTFKETFESNLNETLWILFAAVGLLLLIACANVSNLLLARAAGRQREMAMRAALGASRGRIVRQLLTESLLLGAIGAVLGIAGSYGALQGILAVMPKDVIPDESEIVLNGPVLLFSVLVTLVSTVLFGLAPAWHASGGALANPLKEASRSRGSRWMRSALVTVELSLAIVLLSVAGLFLKTLVAIYNAPMAVDVRDRLIMVVPLQEQKRTSAEARAAFVTRMLESIRATPGVVAASINTGLHPLGAWDFPVEIPGSANVDKRPVDFHQVDERYLQTTGIKLRRGRFIEAADVGARRNVVVVNEEFVKRYFAGQEALGKQVKASRLKMAPFNVANDVFEIVGVAQNALFDMVNGAPNPEMYVPHSITGLANVLTIHTAGDDPMRAAQPVRRAIYALDGTQFVDVTKPLTTLIDDYAYAHGRFRLWLMGAFAAVGLALAVIGVYGLLAHVVAQQRREFGVRMALGATFGTILRLVFARGARLILAGLVVGVVVSVLLLRQFGAKLGVANPLDAQALAAACGVLALAALAACLFPALRAARVAPAEALRAE
jgi:predicted permease